MGNAATRTVLGWAVTIAVFGLVGYMSYIQGENDGYVHGYNDGIE